MEPVEGEEVMTVVCGCTVVGLVMRGGTVHCTRRGPALLGGDHDFRGLSLFIRKKQAGVGLSGYDEKALTVAHRKGLISYGAFVQN